MREERICPECDSTDTDHVHTEAHPDVLERVFICRDCPTQYTVTWQYVQKETDDVPL